MIDNDKDYTCRNCNRRPVSSPGGICLSCEDHLASMRVSVYENIEAAVQTIARQDTMRFLGFHEVSPEHASYHYAQCSTVSAGGDRVWIHEETGIWFQGVPVSGEQVFKAIYNCGFQAGDEARSLAIRKALML